MTHLRYTRAQRRYSICPEAEVRCPQAGCAAFDPQNVAGVTPAIPRLIPSRCTVWQMPQRKSPRYANLLKFEMILRLERRSTMLPLGRTQFLKFAAVGTLLAISRQLAEAENDGTPAKTDLFSNLYKRSRAATGDRKKAVIDEAMRLIEQLSSDGKIGGLAQVNGGDGEARKPLSPEPSLPASGCTWKGRGPHAGVRVLATSSQLSPLVSPLLGLWHFLGRNAPLWWHNSG